MKRFGLFGRLAVVTMALVVPSLPAAIGSGAPVAAAPAVMCHGHVATKVGTAGDDRIEGTPHRDVIAGLAGDDAIFGNGGSDIICGGTGDDYIRAGAGDDVIYSGS